MGTDEQQQQLMNQSSLVRGQNSESLAVERERVVVIFIKIISIIVCCVCIHCDDVVVSQWEVQLNIPLIIQC